FAGQMATVLHRRSNAPEEDFARLPVRIERDGGTMVTMSIVATLGEVWRTQYPLEPGAWLLHVEAQGFRAFETIVEVKSEEQTPVKVLLEIE
ncbi:MAG: hypothetical protein V3T22_08515, partial [Planctomycetota bacterium]